jgi:hypothetical protein
MMPGPVCPGLGERAKKYSVESAKPLKFPRGEIRPDAACCVSYGD